MMNPNPYGSPQMAPMPNYMATPVFPNQPTQMVYNQPVMYATGPTLYTPTPTGVPGFSPPNTPPMYPPSNPFPTFSQPQPEVVNPPAPVVEVKIYLFWSKISHFSTFQVKKGRLYVTLGSATSQSFQSILTSDGIFAFHLSDRQSPKPKETFAISPNDPIKLEAGGLTITHENSTLILNAVSSNALKEWYDAISDLQKELRHSSRPVSTLSASSPSPSTAHVRSHSGDQPMNYDSTVIPVPPRPSSKTLKQGTQPKLERKPRKKSSSESVLPNMKSESELVPPRPRGHTSKLQGNQKLVRSNSLGKTGYV